MIGVRPLERCGAGQSIAERRRRLADLIGVGALQRGQLAQQPHVAGFALATGVEKECNRVEVGPFAGQRVGASARPVVVDLLQLRDDELQGCPDVLRRLLSAAASVAKSPLGGHEVVEPEDAGHGVVQL